jgi:hypothetical protein
VSNLFHTPLDPQATSNLDIEMGNKTHLEGLG